MAECACVVQLEWKQSRKRKTGFGRELSSVEKTEERDATFVPEIDDVPDVERSVLQSQPA
jgi:hypothetical protein